MRVSLFLSVLFKGLARNPALEMERDAEEPDSNETSTLWSGSDGSPEHSGSESLADSFYEDEASDAEFRSDPQPARVEAEEKAPELYQNEEWKSTGEQQQVPGLNGGEAEVSYQGEDEEDDLYPCSQRPGSEHRATKIPETRSSSSSLDCAADVTLALSPSRGQGQKASSRRCPGTLNTGVDSSEEGGSHEAPPASLFFGMSDEGAEQAETWNCESDTDLCRALRQRPRNTCEYFPSASLQTVQQPVSVKPSMCRGCRCQVQIMHCGEDNLCSD